MTLSLRYSLHHTTDEMMCDAHGGLISAANVIRLSIIGRRIGYRDVARPWASVHSPSLAHSRGMLSLQPSETLLTAHVSENFSKHTSLIHYLSVFYPIPFL